MNEARPWLPKDCLKAERTAQDFAGAVKEWSGAWFVANHWISATRFSQQIGTENSVIRQEDRLAILGGNKTMLALALAILGKPMRSDLKERDLRLLRRLAGSAIDDLIVRLNPIMPSRTESRSYQSGEALGKWYLPVGSPPTHFILCLDEEDIAARALANFPRIVRTTSLVPRRSAIQSLEVSTKGLLGKVWLSLDQVANLEAGDVLLLDRDSDTPVELLLNNAPTKAAFALAQTDNGLALARRD